MYAILENDYSKINTLYETSITGNQLDVYHNGLLLGSFVTRDEFGVPPLTSPAIIFDKSFEAVSTLTSVGLRWVFDFIPSDINLEEFTSGVWHFVLNPENVGNTTPVFGFVHSLSLSCCIAQYIKTHDESCGLGYYEAVVKAEALLFASRHAVRAEDIDTAVCAYTEATCTCNTCS